MASISDHGASEERWSLLRLPFPLEGLFPLKQKVYWGFAPLQAFPCFSDRHRLLRIDLLWLSAVIQEGTQKMWSRRCLCWALSLLSSLLRISLANEERS